MIIVYKTAVKQIKTRTKVLRKYRIHHCYSVYLSKMVKGHHGHQKKMEPNTCRHQSQVIGHHFTQIKEIPTSSYTEI